MKDSNKILNHISKCYCVYIKKVVPEYDCNECVKFEYDFTVTQTCNIICASYRMIFFNPKKGVFKRTVHNTLRTISHFKKIGNNRYCMMDTSEQNTNNTIE